MKSSIRKSIRAALSGVVVLLLSVATSGANAVVVNIDPSQSSVTYTPSGFTICDPFGNCSVSAQPQTFALSGSFNVRQDRVFVVTSFFPLDGYERDQIQFDSLAVDSGGAAALGFEFPTYLSVLLGATFQGSEDYCTWFPSTGACTSMGWFGEYSGTFDGSTLSMTGLDYAGDFLPSTFSFTLVARVADSATVAEPGILACLAVAGLGMGAIGRRRTHFRG
ncbi:MAG: PEP-CTERM sorting domain-containing protein [Azonexus sp.]|nr:PEP-CTERM sorting domain-containing protein [Betaproteobacteria bacterium]MBK8918763.1 PEP-CTERM sorting domain-containing protein [Betaproteobacteria bacterium]MBP6034696.1 PEP-CTERM sorting domain-containing protein [Azonexus sp.]MBP6905236.1 PEP-CTERM sorting domain-containing protein [Azonexus sp.]